MLRRKTKPEPPPNQDAESPPEPPTAPKPDATPKEEPWWAVTTPRNEARLFFAVYFLGESASAQKLVGAGVAIGGVTCYSCLLYTSPSPRDKRQSRMPSSA